MSSAQVLPSGTRSRLRAFAATLARAVLAAALFFGVCELAARYLFGFRPLTPGTFLFESHPRWGWAHRANASELFVKLGFQQPIDINSKGLRERELAYEKEPGVFRVFVVGDSNVAGFEVGEEETFTRVTESILRERGHRVEFINGGHRGYGTDQSLLFLTEEGMKYQPDLVLYFWSDNDVDDNITIHRPFRRFGKGWFDVDAEGALQLEGVPVPEFDYEEGLQLGGDGQVRHLVVPGAVRASVMARDAIATHSGFATFLIWAVARMPRAENTVVGAGSFGDFRESGGKMPAADPANRSFRLTLALIREMQRVAAAGGAGFQMIGIGGEWSKSLRAAAGMPELHDWDSYVAVVPNADAVKTPFDPHWNALGNRLYAEQLARLLVEHGLILPAPAAGLMPAPAAGSEPVRAAP